MTNINETKSALHSVVSIVIALAILLSASICQKSQAATDDVEFNDCVQALDQNPGALTTDTWHKTPLNPKIFQLEKPTLYGSVVIRWISHQNKNGTKTIIVLTRDPEPQPEDDPDGFDVILEQHGHLAVMAGVGANGFSFSKESNGGVNGLLFCTRGNISRLWVWEGNNWEVSK